MLINKSLILFILLFILSVSTASAHVVVKPSSVGVGTRNNFTIGVPVEKEIPTTQLRLVIPEGVKSVTPNVKPGWKITIKKEGTGDSEVVKEVVWSGGQIPAGQRDEFVFSAQAPTQTTELKWAAYQTYADGSVVAWDEDSQEVSHDDKDDHESGPSSKTSVVNDLNATNSSNLTSQKNGSIDLSVLALVVAAVSLVVSFLKRK